MIDKMRRNFVRRTAVSMMALLFAATLAAQTTPAPTAPTAPTQEWKTYSYPADGFSASFPFEPTFAKRECSHRKGQLRVARISGRGRPGRAVRRGLRLRLRDLGQDAGSGAGWRPTGSH